MADLTHRMVPTNGVELHVVSAGEGFPVVLLHGFPQTWYEWRHLIQALAPRFRVIAPDLRGIGDSAPSSEGQDKRTLAADIKGLLDALEIDRAVIAGHDWGGAVAQRFALDYTEATERLIGIDIPYFPLLPPNTPWNVEQLVHSWYLFMHQDPKLPEQFAEQAGEAYLRWFYEHGAGDAGSPFTDADVAEYARWFTAPGRATAGFNLYRTMFTVDAPHWAADAERKLELPTLWIHGAADPFVPAGLTGLLPRAFSNLRVEQFEGCGHWVPEEEPERTAELFLDFLKEL